MQKCFFELSPFFVLFYKTFLIQAKKLADSMRSFRGSRQGLVQARTSTRCSRKKYCADPEEEVPQESCTAFSRFNSGFVCRTEQFDFFSYSSFDSFCATSKQFTRIELLSC